MSENKSKELDLIKFNKEFEEKDKENYFLNKPRPVIKKVDPNLLDKNKIDYIIMDLRLAFDFILNSFINKKNPVPGIINNKKLSKGTIYLLFFIGGFTLLLSVIMKE